MENDDLLPDQPSDSPNDNKSSEMGPPKENKSDETFVPWESSKFKRIPKSQLAHRTIVQSKYLSSGGRTLIVPQMPPGVEDDNSKADISPMMDGDQIVGLKVVCSCGIVHEIMFEYSSEK